MSLTTLTVKDSIAIIEKDVIILSPEQKGKVKLVIPTEIEVEASRLEGDTESGIRFEIELGEQESPYVQECLARGARVFVTETDSYLVINPEKD